MTTTVKIENHPAIDSPKFLGQYHAKRRRLGRK